MTAVILMGIAGKVFIFLFQKFSKNLNIKSEFLKKLFECQLCLGFWVYLILSMTLQVYLFTDLFYFPVVSAIITAACVDFIVFLVSLGWNEFFGGKVYVIKE